MSVHQTPSGRWQVRWRDENRRGRARTFRTKTDAIRFDQTRLLTDPAATAAALAAQLDQHFETRRTAALHATALSEAIDVGGYYVYCLWPAHPERRPFYIGRSANVLARLGDHATDPAKRGRLARVTLTRCESYEEMCALEANLIAYYRPEMNIAGVA